MYHESRKAGKNLRDSKLTEQIIAAAIRVHRALGPGFLESVYEVALAVEFTEAGISFERQKTILIFYGGKPVGEHRLDYVINARVVLELKACKNIEDIHLPVARSYLKA